MNTYDRFNDYIELYDTYRLEYNNDVIKDINEFIEKTLKINKIADIGSGTGILTRQLLKYEFKKYYAIEPNKNMQNQSIIKNKNNKITHLNCMSHETGLKSKSIDKLIVFVNYIYLNRFNPEKSLLEFNRILKKGGFLVIIKSGYGEGNISNDLDLLHKKYKNISDVKKSERYDNSMKNYSNKFYTSISYKEIKLDLYKFIGMELSMSTAPTKDDKLYKKYI